MYSTIRLISVCAFLTVVSGTVHYGYIKSRWDIFNDDDYRIVFPHHEDESSSLVHIHVLFRHGNRTADSQAELYPNDPYLNYTYFPHGLGQLTNAGKRREFAIGEALRRRYDDFLGKYYYPEIVEAISTDYNRTKMSLQLVLAGLFPPRSDDIFNGLVWQPVPFNYLPRPEDTLLLGVLCPRYLELYEDHYNSNKVKSQMRKHRRTFDYISRNSGLNVTRYQDIYQLFFGLSTESEFGLKLPQWLNTVWPDTIIDLAIQEYYVSMGTTNLRKMAAGYLLNKILDDAKRIIENRAKLCRKIHLYSAHENNVAQLLIALGIFEPHIPNYGAYLIMELHRINGEYGYKIFYENWTGGGPKLMKMPKCGAFCPLEKFKSLVDEHLPLNDNLCGNS
nr:unnamed protein product [Callosobruchus analis]